MAGVVSKEEENYLRIVKLMVRIAPVSVRVLFDKYFPPASLQTTLLKEKCGVLQHLYQTRRINQVQWNSMFPPQGKAVSSSTFDLTLMICLMRNLPGPVLNIVDKLPPNSDISEGADLSRIKFFRNKMAHSEIGLVTKTDFNAYWNDLTEAIVRLGGATARDSCNYIKTSRLDDSDKEILTDFLQSKNQITEHEKRIDKLETSRDELSNRFQAADKILDQLNDSSVTAHRHLRDNDTRLDQIENKMTVENVGLKKVNAGILSDWTKDQIKVVDTRSIRHMKDKILSVSCILVTGGSGTGKSTAVHHVALYLHQSQDYEIIPVDDVHDLLHAYNPKHKQVFVIDDFCGKFSIDFQAVEHWCKKEEKLKKIFCENTVKILLTCRRHIYLHRQLKSLLFMTSNVCDFQSEEFSLNHDERIAIARSHLLEDDEIDILKNCAHLHNWPFFPLLCQLYPSRKIKNLYNFFEQPESVICQELSKYRYQWDQKTYGTLALFVLCNNKISIEKLNTGNLQKEIDNISQYCDLQCVLTPNSIKTELNNLNGSFVPISCLGVNICIHDKIFDIFVRFFGEHMFDCIVKGAHWHLIRDRFVFESSSSENYDYSVIVPQSKRGMFYERVKNEILGGNLGIIASNALWECEHDAANFNAYLENQNEARQIIQIVKKDKKFPIGEIVSKNLIYSIPYIKSLGIDINTRSLHQFRVPALILATKGNHLEMVKQLLRYGAKINIKDTFGSTPLFFACEGGNEELVMLLIENGANVNFAEKIWNKTPLYAACLKGHADIVKVLLQNGANVNASFMSEPPLYSACLVGNEEIVNLLIDHNADVNLRYKFRTPLHAAVQGYIENCSEPKKANYLNSATMLITGGADLNNCDRKGESPLYYAVKNNNAEAVNFLIENGADTNPGRTWPKCFPPTSIIKLYIHDLLNRCIHNWFEVICGIICCPCISVVLFCYLLGIALFLLCLLFCMLLEQDVSGFFYLFSRSNELMKSCFCKCKQFFCLDKLRPLDARQKASALNYTDIIEILDQNIERS